jgi:hypothetical protein
MEVVSIWLELVLYGSLLVLILILRWWGDSKVAVGPVRVLKTLKTLPKTRRPHQRKSGGAAVSRPSVDDLPWRKMEEPKVENASPERPVIDLAPAFAPKPSRDIHMPQVPPNSPCYGNVDGGYCGFGLDPSFEEFVVTKDTDFERRRQYIKKQVTDGEVMMELESTYQVCQIFVHGIEYHYIYDGVRTCWDLPDRLDYISNWFLKIPESRKKKFGSDPPIPIRHDPDPVPFFI